MSGGIYFESGIDDGFLKDLRAMNTQMNNLGNTVELQGAKMDSVFRNVGASIAAYVGVDVLKSVGSNIVDTTAKFEKFGIVLENTLGSKLEADTALNMVAKFAAKTPFQLDEVTDSFIKLTNQGFQPTYEEMTKLGDVASSTGKGFNELTEALLDAQTGEYERLKEFGIKASANGDKVTFTFKNVKTTVDNTSDSIQKYILSLGDLKGVVGANAKISEGMAGSISNLADEFAAMYNTIGTNNKDTINDGISGIRFLVQNYATIGKILEELVLVYGAYKAAVMVTVAWQEAQAAAIVQTALAGRALTTWETIHTAILYKVNAAQKALNGTMLANPYVLAATAVIALVGALALFSDNTVDADATVKELNKSIEDTSTKANAALRNLQALNNDTGTSLAGRKKLIQDINKEYGDYLPNLLTEASTQAEVNKALKVAGDAMERKIKLDAINNALTQERVKLAELEKTAADKSFTGYLSASQAYIDIPKQKKVIQDLQKQLVTVREEGAKQEIIAVGKKMRTIKSIEGEIAELSKKRKESTDVADSPTLKALEAQIKEKQAELDALDGKKQKEVKDTRIDALNTLNQQRINTITDQYGREEATQREFQEKLLENEIRYYTEKAKLLKNALDKEENKGSILRASIALTQSQQQEFQQLLASTKQFTTQRGELVQKGEREIAELYRAGYGDNAEVRKEQMEQALVSLDTSFAEQSATYKQYLEETLPSIIKQGVEFIQGELSRISLQIAMEGDPEKLAILQAELLRVKDALKGVEKDAADTSKKLTFPETMEALGSIQDSLLSISNVLGDSVASASLQVVGGVLQIVQAVQAASVAMTALETASLILVAVATAVKVVSMLLDARAKKAKEVDEAVATELELQYKITAELIKQNALNKENSTFFSKDPYGTMLANLRSYNATLEQQKDIIQETIDNAGNASRKRFMESQGGTAVREEKEAFKASALQQDTPIEQALASIVVTTKDRSKLANAFGAKDQYDDLLSQYPELIDAQGKLNQVILEQVVADDRLSAADSARMNNLLENARAMEAYYDSFGEYIAGIFGGIGDAAAESMQQLYEVIISGSGDTEEAMQSLEKSVSSMIESFTRDSIKYAFIEPLLGNLNSVSKQLGSQYAAGSITAEKMQADITGALGAFYANIQAIQPQLLGAYASADRLAAAAGFTSAFSSESTAETTPSARSAGAQVQATITEQTGTILTGHTGAIMLSTERLASTSAQMLQMSARNALYLQEIRDSVLLNLPAIAQSTKRMAEKL